MTTRAVAECNTERGFSRAEAKAVLIEEDYMVLQARLVRDFGPAAGIYLRQLIFWDGKGADPDGWVYKSAREMEEETGLTTDQQRGARKKLCERGVLEAQTGGRTNVYHYRPDLVKLLKLLEIEVPQKPMTEVPSTDALLLEKPQTTSGEPPNHFSENPKLYTESTSESTPIDSPLQGDGADLSGRRPSPQNKEIEEKRERTETRRERFDPKEINAVVELLYDEGEDAGRVYRRYIEGKLLIEPVAEAVSWKLTGEFDQAKRYLPLVRHVDGYLRGEIVAEPVPQEELAAAAV